MQCARRQLARRTWPRCRKSIIKILIFPRLLLVLLFSSSRRPVFGWRPDGAQPGYDPNSSPIKLFHALYAWLQKGLWHSKLVRLFFFSFQLSLKRSSKHLSHNRSGCLLIHVCESPCAQNPLRSSEGNYRGASKKRRGAKNQAKKRKKKRLSLPSPRFVINRLFHYEDQLRVDLCARRQQWQAASQLFLLWTGLVVVVVVVLGEFAATLMVEWKWCGLVTRLQDNMGEQGGRGGERRMRLQGIPIQKCFLLSTKQHE